MNKSVEFGSRENFCIRIGYTKRPKKLYLQFWLKGVEWGNFKKADSLEYSIKTYQKIVKNKNLLYLPQLENLTKDQTWKYLKCIDSNNGLDSDKFSYLYDIGTFPFFGQHFGNQQCYHTVTYNDNFLRFMWQNDFGKPVNDVQIKFDDFCTVFEEYRLYCEANHLI